MGGIFSKPSFPNADTSATNTARRRAEERANKLEQENQARLRNLRNRRRGRALMAFKKTGELGIVQSKKQKLGE